MNFKEIKELLKKGLILYYVCREDLVRVTLTENIAENRMKKK